jgi:hypothetical protein
MKIYLGKVKYNDKILHQSKIIKYYVEGENKKKFKKILIKFLKKLLKIKNILFLQKI